LSATHGTRKLVEIGEESPKTPQTIQRGFVQTCAAGVAVLIHGLSRRRDPVPDAGKVGTNPAPELQHVTSASFEFEISGERANSPHFGETEQDSKM
jgi:hypothetical protein